VFEPFFTTKAEGQGTGLGLATVYGIIKQNQGAITVYSHPGIGTSFHLYLPECRDQEPAQAPEAAAPVAGGSETVLVVEDEKALLSAMELALAGKGYRVLAAASPLDALLLVQQHAGPIHMLVTDVVMPGLNGKELAARIGRDRPGLRVLYLSGYTGDILARRGLITENIRFMQKPFRLLDLTRQVREALDAPDEAGGGRNPG
jgi:CheY-like chemotaxis protein